MKVGGDGLMYDPSIFLEITQEFSGKVICFGRGFEPAPPQIRVRINVLI
jgi:hypothetical protein